MFKRCEHKKAGGLTFRPFVDHPLRFSEQGNALRKRRDQHQLRYSREYSERQRGPQHRAQIDTC